MHAAKSGAGAQTEGYAVAGLLTPGSATRGVDVARVKEHHRQSRLKRTAVLMSIPFGFFAYRDLTGHWLVSMPRIPPSMVPMVPAGVLILVLMVIMLAPLLGAGKSPHILYRPDQLDVGLDDVVGIDANKAEVTRTINLFLGHRAFRDHMGGAPRRGLLFEGPPGTGKTFTAKAMAKDAGVPFLFVSSSSFQSMFYGQTNRKIRSYFRALRKFARAEGGAIGFIEEIDAIGAARQGMSSTGTQGVAGVVNELLVQLQSFDEPTKGQRIVGFYVDVANKFLSARHQLTKPQLERPNVLVVAATNRRDDLDPALIRPGRFDRSIYFGLPGRVGRSDIIAYYLAKKSHVPALSSEAAVDELAGMTMGYSPADLERLLDESLIVALTDGRTEMTMADISAAKLSVELGVTDSAVYTDAERIRVATHEAGHAAVAYVVGEGRKLDVLSIIKRRDSLGLLQHSDTEERFMQTREDMEALLRIAMGGLAAEEIFFGNVSSGPAGDLLGATQLACAMVGGYGMGSSLLSIAAGSGGPFGGSLVDKVMGDDTARAEADGLLQAAHQAARDIITAERSVVEALRDALVSRSELVGTEIIDVIVSAETTRSVTWAPTSS
ncbi:MAG TPA: AAA family ATPase [Acidimicrobiales bacterium]|nr:AAA family ATPase [Acidimicrobiales bacterium]